MSREDSLTAAKLWSSGLYPDVPLSGDFVQAFQLRMEHRSQLMNSTSSSSERRESHQPPCSAPHLKGTRSYSITSPDLSLLGETPISPSCKVMLYSPPVSVLFQSTSSEEKVSPSCPLPMERGVSSDSFPSVCFSSLIGLLSCGAVSTGPEDAIETTLVVFVGEVWTSTSLYVTIPIVRLCREGSFDAFKHRLEFVVIFG
ncbi:unnamed protein product [Brassica napus]|uniref:(rape) hypothetical protein n=1 Tax=Brassica napus TaxID=3708 RepID=A0A816J5C4_BRANA|nr:unnamed protein product [Brassica napus]